MELARIGYPLINQDQARPILLKQLAQSVAWVCRFLVVGLAMWVELGFAPPWWVHALLWPPLVTLTTIVGLRFGKAVLLALEYRHEAAEGRLRD